MDDKQAAELRKPFPRKTIGLKPQPFKKDSPKSKCEVCHGYHGQPATHLEYVGHAATTDRLLQVDPEWSWEPMAYDMNGLPLFDGGKNLWIKLTVCGVTRLGVGDGMGIKECIGDAIRNAAMRFGVALDLWAKEDLGGVPSNTPSHVTEGPPAPATRTMSRNRPPAESPEAATKLQLAKLHLLLQQNGMGDRDTGLRFLSERVGRSLVSSKELTKAEASQIIDSEQPSEAVLPEIEAS